MPRRDCARDFRGRRVRHLSDSLSEPFGVLQAAMLGVVGLILAFGLSLALSRYEDAGPRSSTRRTRSAPRYLRAQTLAEPVRSRSLDLLVAYTESAVRLSENMPGSAEENAVAARGTALQRRLWTLAGQAVDAAPTASAPRLYIETLNEMIDAQTDPGRGAEQPGPEAVLWLEILGASIALGLLAAYLALVGVASPGCCSPRYWWRPCSSSPPTSTARPVDQSRSPTRCSPNSWSR